MLKHVFAILSRSLSYYILFLICPSVVFAVDTLVKEERFQMDWARQRLSFYGEAQQSPGISLKQAESLARSNAQDWLTKNAKKEIKNEFGIDLDPEALEKLKSAGSINTVYSADRKLRVYFEMASSELWSESLAKVGSQSRSYESHRNSGIAIRVKGLKSPVFSYNIIDENGQVLFDPSKVKKDSFAKRQLGTWKRQISSADAKQILGDSPVQVEAKLSENGRDIVIQKKDWEEFLSDNEALLGESKQVLIFGL